MSFVVSGFASQIPVSTEPSALNVPGPLDMRQWLDMRLRFRVTIGGKPTRPQPTQGCVAGRAPSVFGSSVSGVSGVGRDVVQPARALAYVRRLSVFTLIPHRAVLDGTPVFCLISRLRFSQFLFRVLGLRTILRCLRDFILVASRVVHR